MEKKHRGCRHVALEGAEAVTHVVISDHVVEACVDCAEAFEACAAKLDIRRDEPEKKRRVAAG